MLIKLVNLKGLKRVQVKRNETKDGSFGDIQSKMTRRSSGQISNNQRIIIIKILLMAERLEGSEAQKF